MASVITTAPATVLPAPAPAIAPAPTARAARLLPCHVCGLLCDLNSEASPHHHARQFEEEHDDQHQSAPHCPRCGAVLHARKPDSLQRSWAFLVAAATLYIPANLLPIMKTSALFDSQKDTILSGVVYLWNDGSWVLSLIVFFASIVIPLGKLIGLGYLLITVQRGERRKARERTRLYRLIEAVGRWSMLDIYVVALLAALVRLRPLAEIDVGPGALAFGAVVVLTMLATHAFDPRLIWDAGHANALPDDDEDDED